VQTGADDEPKDRLRRARGTAANDQVSCSTVTDHRSSTGDRCVWPSVVEAVGRTSHGARLTRLASAGPRDEGPWRQPPLATAGSSRAVDLAIVCSRNSSAAG